MMVSNFVNLVHDLIGMSMSAVIVQVIVAVIIGTIAHKVASSIESHVSIAVAGLVALTFWFHFWEINESNSAVFSTVVVVVLANDIYKRLVRGNW